MKVALMAVDSSYPNLALMKISAYHKRMGDEVFWYNELENYDMVYMAKVFTFTPDYMYYIHADKVIKGGTGYDIHSSLPHCIDSMQPDYSIYPSIPDNTAYGFLTRGCPNKCKWCIVPQKEGPITPYMDIEEIAVGKRNKIILMDNNILAAGDYGLCQIEKSIRLNLRIDFNQGLDARLVTEDNAPLLAMAKWIKLIRFGCDTPQQVKECDRAIELLDKYGYRGEYLLYCILLDDFRESFIRVNHWRIKGKRFLPYCQPYRDINDNSRIIPQWQKDMAGWADKKWIFRKCEFKDFEPRRGFRCREYFIQYGMPLNDSSIDIRQKKLFQFI